MISSSLQSALRRADDRAEAERLAAALRASLSERRGVVTITRADGTERRCRGWSGAVKALRDSRP